MRTNEANILAKEQKIKLINMFGCIVLNPLTTQECIDKLINMMKNEAERLKFTYVLQNLQTYFLAKDSENE